MAKTISLAKKRHDNTLWTPADAVRDALEDIEAGRWKDWPHVLVIGLDNRDGKYEVSYRAANLSASQMVALLEVLKAQILRYDMEP